MLDAFPGSDELVLDEFAGIDEFVLLGFVVVFNYVVALVVTFVELVPVDVLVTFAGAVTFVAF